MQFVQPKATWNVLRGITIIFFFLMVGEIIAKIPWFPLPGNVSGMILIFMALQSRIIRLDWVKPGSNLLLKNMALFFVPPGVGLMLYFDLISKYWLSIIVSSIVSSLLVMWVTGFLYLKMMKK
jgi:holin-like protein